MTDWKCGAAQNLSLHESDSWDGDAAKAAIFEWAGFDTNSPDTAKARKAFLAYDADDPDKKSSYKLPFCDVVDGELVADSNGINAASSRLSSTDIPDDVKDEAESIIESYKNKMEDDSDRSNHEIHAFAVRAVNKTILSEDELTERLISRAMNPDAFKSNPPFLWGVKASTNEVDSYFTRMAPSTLKNFAADAENGVSFQNSHRYAELPFGRSLAGKHTGAGGNSLARMEADFFTVRGGNFNGVSTDQLILGMETGIFRDVSVGFYGGNFRCSICNRDPFDWWADDWCPHIPGVEYDIKDKDGNVTDRQVAIAWIENARLAEVSVVFDGACPGAAIRKAEMEARAGRIQPEIAALISDRYRIKLPGGASKRWAGHSSRTRSEVMGAGARNIKDEDLLEVAQKASEKPAEGAPAAGGGEVVDQPSDGSVESAAAPNSGTENSEVVPGATDGAGAAESADSGRSVSLVDGRGAPLTVVGDDFGTQLGNFLRESGVKPGEDPEETIRLMVSEIRTLRPAAKDGEAYRRDLVAEALTAGIQAYGNDFDKSTYEDLLRTAPLDTIKRMRDDFKTRSGGTFPAQRLTIEGETEDNSGARAPKEEIPNSSYMNA